jgi:hypothetical protein
MAAAEDVAAQRNERLRVLCRVIADAVFAGLLPADRAARIVLDPIVTALDKEPRSHHTVQSLSLIHILLRHCGAEMTGGRIVGAVAEPSHPTANEAALNRRAAIAAARETAAATDPVAPTPAVASSIVALLQRLAQHSGDVCGKLKSAVENKWRQLAERTEYSGEVPEATQAQFRRLKKEVDRLIDLNGQIARAVGLEQLVVAPVDLQRALQRSAVDTSVVVTSKLGEFYSVREEAQSRFDDDDQANFYEGFPSLDHMVSADFLGANAVTLTDETLEVEAVPEMMEPFNAVLEHLLEQLPSQVGATRYADEWLEAYLRVATVFRSTEGFVEGEELPEAFTVDGKRLVMPPHTAVGKARIFFTNARRRLLTTLRYVPGSALEVIPFYARIVAVLNRLFKDFGEWLGSKFEGDAFYVAANAVQKSYQRRMRNARFLAELLKFRVVPPSRVLRACAKLVEELDKENVNAEVLASLLEQAGPFISRGGVTAAKMVQLTTAVRNKMTVAGLPPHLEARLNESLEIVRRATLPRKAAARMELKARSVFELYIRDLLFMRLVDRDSVGMVTTKLLSMPWEDLEVVALVVRMLRKSSRCRWDRLHLLADVVARLTLFHPVAVHAVVDTVMEDLRLDLEFPQHRALQKQLIDLKFIGELYRAQVVPTSVLLYTICSLVLYHPHGFSATPGDYSRVRAFCTLLETSGSYFVDEDNGPLAQFMRKIIAHFFAYVHTRQTPLPHDLDCKLSDVIFPLTDKLNRAASPGTPRVVFPPTMEDATTLLKQFPLEGETVGVDSLSRLTANVAQACAARKYSASFTAVANGSVATRTWQLPTIDSFFDSTRVAQAISGDLHFASSGLRADDDHESTSSDSTSTYSATDDSDSEESSCSSSEAESTSSDSTESTDVSESASSEDDTTFTRGGLWMKARGEAKTAEDEQMDSLMQEMMREGALAAQTKLVAGGAGMQRTNRNVEERLSQGAALLLKTRMAGAASTSNASRSATSSLRLASSGTNEQTAPAQKMTLLRRVNDKSVAAEIFVPGSSELAQRNAANVAQHEAEQREIRTKTLLIAKSEVAENAKRLR